MIVNFILLNCDYKIAAKAIANRLKRVLPRLIDHDQTGFPKGRFIGENIRLVDATIKYTAAKNIPGLLLFLDFEKAFDTVEWSFIQKTFRHFNFGPTIINWIKLFYNDTESSILNNGWSSDFFKLGRGVRQGCPLSPYLFILCVEVLADVIRKNCDIKGITVNGSEVIISQYADDTALILDGSRRSLTTSLKVLDLFSEISGLRLNRKKTEALWIGANPGSEEKLCPEIELKWMRDKVKTLGVWLSTDPVLMMKANYDEKLTKLKASLGCLEMRRLSLLGKITVLKSLMVSQLVYILSPLPTDHEAVKEVNNRFYNFLWGGRGDKIKRNIMISNYEQGGLKMIDVINFAKALKSNWIKKYLDQNNLAKWKLFFDSHLHGFGGATIFNGNLNQKDLLTVGISDSFLLELLQIWSEIAFEDRMVSVTQLRSQSIWFNSLIRIGNKPIYFKPWATSGIQNISDLMTNESTFLSFSDFKDRYKIKPPFLSFLGVISAIKLLWNKTKQERPTEDSHYNNFRLKCLQASKSTRVVYRKLVEKRQKKPQRSQMKWSMDCMFEQNEPVDWVAIYKKPFECTKISKLLVFQFKLFHRRLATNTFLEKINLIDNNLCSFCQREKETLIHLFWNCAVTSSFWQDFKNWLLKENPLLLFDLSPSLVIGLKPQPLKNKYHYFSFLVARFFIWTCRIRGQCPKIEGFPPFLSHYNLSINTE